MAEALFYLLALLTLSCACATVLAPSPVFGVIALLSSLFCLAVIYLLAGFQFLAAAQIVVYAGAILVLFLFVIMLLDLGDSRQRVELSRAAFQRRGTKLAAALALALAFGGLIAARRSALQPSPPGSGFEHGIDRLGPLSELLFGRYGLAFEATGMLLLATMVAVVALAKRQRGRPGRVRGSAGLVGGSTVEPEFPGKAAP